MLSSQPEAMFLKYIDVVKDLVKPNNKVLDVGCGAGNFLYNASSRIKNVKFYGVDISETSISKCNQQGLDCALYNGNDLPFPDSSFDIVGSINVLEHTNNPALFLDEKLRVLRSGGFLIVACPNFLSVSNSYHHHTRGTFRKAKNVAGIIIRLLSAHRCWEKMDTIERQEFQPDDDACNVTNPVDILKWGKSNNLDVLTWSSQTIYRDGLLNFFDKFYVPRLLLGSSFMIMKKKIGSIMTLALL